MLNITLVDKYRFTIFKTPFGFSGLIASSKGLLALILPGDLEGLMTKIIERYKDLVYDPTSFNKISSKIVAYFSGEVVVFDYSLDLSRFSPFQRMVFMEVQKIPYGQTDTYLSIAKKVRSSPRAIGQALKRNPLPIIIPCHRVIRKDGRLCGYSNGKAWKERLLSLEREDA